MNTTYSCRKTIIKTSLILVVLFGSMRLNAQPSDPELSRSEMKVLRQCKGSALAFFHGRQMKEFVRLMNLARTNPVLLRKYIDLTYGQEYTTEVPWAAIDKSYGRNKSHISLLRPSLSLHVGALYHALDNGSKGRVGHQNFDARLILSLNLNTLRTGIVSGENCEYGSRSAIDIFESLMNSAGHRTNILNRDYMRVGVSRKHHKKFGYNTVTMFSGPKLQDWVLYTKQSQSIVKK